MIIIINQPMHLAATHLARPPPVDPHSRDAAAAEAPPGQQRPGGRCFFILGRTRVVPVWMQNIYIYIPDNY